MKGKADEKGKSRGCSYSPVHVVPTQERSGTHLQILDGRILRGGRMCLVVDTYSIHMFVVPIELPLGLSENIARQSVACVENITQIQNGEGSDQEAPDE